MEGTLHTIGGRYVLRFERRLAHPPEKVWKAITDPAEMVHWFPARVETELKVGAQMRFTFEGADEVIGGEIIEIDRPKLFVYLWGEELLRWELIPDGSGCRLIFTHTLSDTRGGALSAGRNAVGWEECLDALSATLEGRAREGSQQRMFERMEHYIQKFGLAEGEVRDHPEGYLVRFVRDLVFNPVEEVWATLTEQDATQADGLVVGASPPLRFTNGYVPAGRVTVVEPQRVLEYTWEHEGAPAGKVRWEISADPRSGTRLVLAQTVPSRLADLRAITLAAWHTHLELFFATLHGVDRCGGKGWPVERTEELEKMYADRIG